jgi:acetylornithine deacetylase/succinyl-diaminopimelate desuccinylase-like protein
LTQCPIDVVVDTLAEGAAVIGRAADRVSGARTVLTGVSGDASAFGGELPQGPFSEMCAAAEQAVEELASTTAQLAHAVGAASVGYLTTDEGVIPIASLKGFAP